MSSSDSSDPEGRLILADLYKQLREVKAARRKLLSILSSGSSGSEGSLDLADLHKQLKDIEKTCSALNDKVLQNPMTSSRVVHQSGVEPCIDSSESSNSLAQDHDTTQTSLRMVDGLETSILNKIKLLSPPHNLPNFPTELLVMIFSELVNDWDSYHDYRLKTPQRSTSDIQNLRLTCRKLRDKSSSFLIHALRVSLTPASIGRLKEISQHPTISQGNFSIKISLALYDPSLVRNFDNFVRYYGLAFAQGVTGMGVTTHDSLHDDWDEVLSGCSWEFREMLKSWYRHSWGKGINHEYKEDHMELLKRAHAKYREYRSQQERLCKTGAFLGFIVAALAKMPHAKNLCMCQEPFDRNEREMPLTNRRNYDMVIQNVMQTKAMRRSSPWCLEDIQSKLLFTLPGEIRKAGGPSLLGLGIYVDCLGSTSSIELSGEDIHNLAQAMDSVQALSIWVGGQHEPCSFDPGDKEEHVAKFVSVFSSLLDMKTLQYVSLHLSFLAPLLPPPGSFAFLQPPLAVLNGQDIRQFFYRKLIESGAWTKLIDLSLTHVPIHLADLRTILNLSVKTLAELTIDHVKLLSGTWAEALDLLYGQYAGVKISVGKNMSGAELDNSIGLSPFVPILGSRGNKSRAQLYLDRETEQNPFRPLTKKVYAEEVEGEEASPN